MSGNSILFLNQADCDAVLAESYDFAIAACEKTLIARANEHVDLPGRLHLRLDEVGGRMFVAPMHVKHEQDVLGLLWMTVFKHGPPSSLTRAYGFYALHEPRTGAPLAILDGTVFDRLGTAATTAVAVRHLALLDSRRAAVVGAGRIGRGLAVALDKVMPQLSDLRLYDSNVNAAKACAKEIQSMIRAEIKVVGTARDAVGDADVVASATTSREPIVNQSWLRKGCFYSQIGASPEAEPAVVLNSDKVVVLDWTENKHQGVSTLAQMCLTGDFDENRIYADLTEIVSGKKAGRETADEMIFFSPLGTAGTSIVLAHHAFEIAKRRGIGRTVELS